MMNYLPGDSYNITGMAICPHRDIVVKNEHFNKAKRKMEIKDRICVIN